MINENGGRKSRWTVPQKHRSVQQNILHKQQNVILLPPTMLEVYFHNVIPCKMWYIYMYTPSSLSHGTHKFP